MRSTSSHSFQPTSPAQTSPVPGPIVSRNGLRKPCATIRRVIGSALRRGRVVGERGAGVRVDAQDRPVAARRVGRRADVLAAQRAALRGRRRRRAARRVAARVDRVAVLPVVGEVERGAVAGRHVQRAARPEDEVADGVARVLLAPVGDQRRLDAAAARAATAGRRRRSRRRSRPAASGRCRPSAGTARVRRVLVVRVEHVDVRPPVREVAGRAPCPSRPRSQKSCTAFERSA